jgi:hypothetical protein
MAKQKSNQRLVRSDERLALFGLFGAAVLVGVLGVFSPQAFNFAKANSTNQAERVIKTEERPADIGQIRNMDSSYAAEQPLEATPSYEMNYMPNNANSYPGY